MTTTERVLAVYDGRPVDRPVWVADMGYWYSAMVELGRLPERYAGDGIVDLYRDLGVDAMETVLACPWTTRHSDVEVTHTEHPGPPRTRVTEWRTPVGVLRQVTEYIPTSCTWACTRYPAASVADLAAVRHIASAAVVEPDYPPMQALMDLYGDHGVGVTMPLRSPMAQLLVEWMGVTNTAYALADDPAAVAATVEALDDLSDRVHAICCGSPAPLLCYGDNVTGEVVSPRLFRRWYDPCYRKRTAAARAHGKRTFVHIDGTVATVLPLVAASGVECGQSLTPAPVGDATLEGMRVAAGPDLVLWGGLPGALFSPVYPECMLREAVDRALEFARQDPRFMLCVCDQVPPDADLGRVEMVGRMVAQAG